MLLHLIRVTTLRCHISNYRIYIKRTSINLLRPDVDPLEERDGVDLDGGGGLGGGALP